MAVVLTLVQTKQIRINVNKRNKENAEVSVAATWEIGLEVSADKTKYMVMFRD